MHTLVSALVRKYRWQSIDISQLTIAQIADNYEEVYLRVANPFWTSDRSMLFSTVTKDYINRNHTLQEFFSSMGNQTLPTIDGIASVSRGSAKYADAYWAGYTVKAGRYNASVDTVVRPSEAETIVLSKPEVE